MLFSYKPHKHQTRGASKTHFFHGVWRTQGYLRHMGKLLKAISGWSLERDAAEGSHSPPMAEHRVCFPMVKCGSHKRHPMWALTNRSHNTEVDCFVAKSSASRLSCKSFASTWRKFGLTRKSPVHSWWRNLVSPQGPYSKNSCNSFGDLWTYWK